MTFTSDERRREIAGNLRYCAEMCHSTGVLDSDVLNALEIHCGDTDGVSSAYDVEKLADLIETVPERTCRMIDNGAELCCSECDWRHDYDDEPKFCAGCGAKVVGFEKPAYGWRYCPNCGAVITDAER